MLFEVIAKGLELAIYQAPALVVFGFFYTQGRRLDLSLDAQLALGGVVFCTLLLTSGSWWVASMGAVVSVACLSLASVLILERGHIPSDIGSLMIALGVFKGLELWVGDGIALVGATSRLTEWWRSNFDPIGIWPLWIAILVGISVLLEWIRRKPIGLMLAAYGSNPAIDTGRSKLCVYLWAVGLLGGSLLGIAGVLLADFRAGVHTGFHLGAVIDAFIVAEVVRVWRTRLQQNIATNGDAKHLSISTRAGYAPITLWLSLGVLVIDTISYVLVFYGKLGFPMLIKSAVVLLLMATYTRSRSTADQTRVPQVAGEESNAPSERGLRIEGLSKSYVRLEARTKVFKDASIHLPERGLFVLVGSNGSGKTTLHKILRGIEEADSGRVFFDGKPFNYEVDFLGQDAMEVMAPDLSVRENATIHLGRATRWENIRGLLSDQKAEILLADSPSGQVFLRNLDRPVASFSGGQIQILAMEFAALGRHPVFLADEPLKMLDPEHTQLVERGLLELAQHRLVIMTAHQPRLDLTPIENHLLLHDFQLQQLQDASE